MITKDLLDGRWRSGQQTPVIPKAPEGYETVVGNVLHPFLEFVAIRFRELSNSIAVEDIALSSILSRLFEQVMSFALTLG